MYSVGHSRVIGAGFYLPEERVSSRQVMEMFRSEERLGISADWLERTTGIRERRASPPDMKPSDLAVKAAQDALDRAGTVASEIDAVIYTGMARDYVEPATAHLVQHKLGAGNAVAFDITNACLGFMNGIHLMDALIASGQVRRGLVVTGERGYHLALKACDVLKKKAERELFNQLAVGLTLGDAGAAMVLGPKLDPDSGFMGFLLESHGEYNDLCVCADGRDSPLVTKITEIVMHTAKYVPSMFHFLMGQKLNWRQEELAKYIPHQVGMRTTRRHATELQIHQDKIPITVDRLGNIISATVPLNIALLQERGELGKGAKLYLAGSGSGISLSQAGLIWDAA